MAFRGKYAVLLTILFLLAFSSRLFFAYQTPYLNEDSYYQLRQIEHIQENLVPMYQDDLSYQGREYYFPPLFQYMMAGFSWFMGSDNAAKIIPPLLFSLLIFLVYGIAYRITKDQLYSFIGALFFTFTPISYVFPINNVSPHVLAIPILFGIIYCMSKMADKRYMNTMLLLIVALVFTHPSAFIFVLGLLFYLALLKVEGMQVIQKKIEIMLFSMFLVFWSLFIIYKNALLSSGFDAVWQNMPQEILASAFPTFTIFQVIYYVGIVPLFMAVFAAYVAVFKKARRPLLLLLGFTLSVVVLLWLNLLRLEIGLLYLSALVSILAAEGLRVRGGLFRNTKFKVVRPWSIFFILLFFILSSVAPLYSSAKEQALNVPAEEDIAALLWIKDNSPEDANIIATLKQGHLVTYFAERKNIADTNFLMVEDADLRFYDLSRMFTLRLKAEALRITDRYDVEYIFLSQEAKEIHGVDYLHYEEDRCFVREYDEGPMIYSVGCNLKR